MQANRQNEPQAENPLQVLHGHQTPEYSTSSQRIAAASLYGLCIWSTSTQQVNQAGVEVEDGSAHVYVVLVILRWEGREVIFAVT